MAADVQLYSTTYCGYCRLAKALLARRNIAFDEIDCTRDDATRGWLVERTGKRTVPQIFIRGVPIGGFAELAAMDARGLLEPTVRGDAAPESVL